MYVRIGRLTGPLAFAALLILSYNGRVLAHDDSPAPTTTLRTSSPTPEKRLTLEWKIGLAGESIANEGGEQAQTAGLDFRNKFGYHLLDSLNFHSDVRVVLEAGRSQSRFGDNAPSNGFFLKEALVDWKPVSFFILHGGAIDQVYLQSPLLVSTRAFPGVMEEISVPGDLLGLDLKFEQTIPTSVTMATRTVDQENTPYFFAETASLNFTIAKPLTAEIYGTHYTFQDLPSAVAFDSAVQGNSNPLELGPNSSRFFYEFDGWLAGITGHWQIAKPWKLGSGFQMLQNSRAPVGFRDGQSAFVDSEFNVSASVALVPKVEQFYNESDTSPAFYNSFEYGHNNRQGYAVDFDVVFKKAGFKIMSQFIDADVINLNRNQTRQQYMLLEVGTVYDQI